MEDALNVKQPKPQDNQIIFTLGKDGRVKLSYRRSCTIAEFLQIISTGILGTLRATIQSMPDEDKEEATDDVYDMFNAAASNILEAFAPEIEMRPALTAKAILEHENKQIDDLLKNNKAIKRVK